MTHLRRTIAALAIVMLLSVDTWAQPQQPRDCLYQVTDSGEERFVGMMHDEPTCSVIARMLNEWAKVEPRSPFVFVCRVRPVRA